jgi:oxaloacetate decarboxylase (Na+ extruding) subunit alpha
VETMQAIFRETEYQVDLDVEALRKINKYFADLTPSRSKGRGFEPAIDSEILVHQIPGGMISNFRSQLEQQGALDKLNEALEEVSRVRADLGYPPLVTPTSQIVGTQAVMNVLTGERYKMVPEEVKKYVKGMYGRSPAPIKPAFIKKILGKEKPIGHRPADDLLPILPNATKTIKQPELLHNEEDILSYCLFPEVATEYFKWRALPVETRPKSPADQEIETLIAPGQPEKPTPADQEKSQKSDPLLHPGDYEQLQSILDKAVAMQLNELVIKKGDFNITLSSGNGGVRVPALRETMNVKASLQAEEKIAAPAPRQEALAVAEAPAGETINAVMAGTFYRSASESSPPFVEEGSVVKEGAPICILEAMKLFNEILAPAKCRILKVLVENGDKIAKGQALMSVEKL